MSTNDLGDGFAKLLGRQATDTEIQALYKVRDALGLRNNDALWLVLMALQYHQAQYERIPQAIAQTSKNVLASFKEAADSQAIASTEAARADLAKAVASVARGVADSTAHKQRAKWIAACSVAVALALSGVGYLGYKGGYDAGYGRGYSEAKDEKAAAAWSNTPEGKLAYRFAQTGSLVALAKCDRPGWHVEKGVCYVKPTSEGTYGWKVQ